MPLLKLLMLPACQIICLSLPLTSLHVHVSRCEVTLAPWLQENPAAAKSNTLQEQQHVLKQVKPRLSCVAVVEEPTTALLVAYSSHNTKTASAAAAAMRFGNSQMRHMFPIANTKTTDREQDLLLRYMARCQAMVGPCR
jgi:hypothetical protein